MNNEPMARIAYTNCPLCDSNKLNEGVAGDCSGHSRYQPIVPKIMQWLDCENCGHQFVSGYFTDECLKMLMTKTGDRQKVGNQIEQQRLVSARMIEKILPYKSSGNWLDVGFGSGALIFTAEEYGFETIGTDLREDNVMIMSELGYEVYCEHLQNLHLDKKMDVISFMDVLEHIPYPKEVLDTAYDMMSEDGCLFVSMPNSDNIVWRLLNRKGINPYLGELEHYHNFGRKRLSALLEECGFVVRRYGVSERYRSCMEIIAQKRL